MANLSVVRAYFRTLSVDVYDGVKRKFAKVTCFFPNASEAYYNVFLKHNFRLFLTILIKCIWFTLVILIKT